MTHVAPFEFDLLRVLHAILGRGPVERAAELILAPRPRPRCLSREALGLIQDTLAKGCVRNLVYRQGWRRQRFLRADRIAEGRLWERTPLESRGLSFSKATLEFLIGLIAQNRTSLPPISNDPDHDLTVGDLVLTYFAYASLRETKAGELLRAMPLYRSHPLCRLAFPADFAEIPDLSRPDWSGWAEEPRAWVLEGLQDDWAQGWLATERGKRALVQPSRMVAIGLEQARIVEGFLVAIDAGGRRDLARFLLPAARELLGGGTGLEFWSGRLNFQGVRLADRTEAHRGALAGLLGLHRLRTWELEARNVGYFDEGYAAAQLIKSDWERFGGEDLVVAARSLFRAADPLASGS